MSVVGERPKNTLSAKKQRSRAVNMYYSFEKELLDESQASKLTEARRSFDPGNSAFHNAAAGWMLAESALISSNLDPDSRLSLINEARQDWERALDIESSKQQSKDLYRHCLLSPGEIRMRSTLATADIYEDLIQGDLRKETRERYHEEMLYLGVKASDGYGFAESLYEEYPDDEYKHVTGVHFVGIAHEVNAILMLSRLKTPSLVCTPALMRADSGVNFPRKTHDLQVHNTKWGKIINSLGIEVKTTPKQEHFDRYDAVLIGGSLHLHPDRLRDPVYLTELLVKDYKGRLDEDEKKTLGAISGNVVHSIRHGFRGIPQCQEIKDCQEIPD